MAGIEVVVGRPDQVAESPAEETEAPELVTIVGLPLHSVFELFNLTVTVVGTGFDAWWALVLMTHSLNVTVAVEAPEA